LSYDFMELGVGIELLVLDVELLNIRGLKHAEERENLLVSR